MIATTLIVLLIPVAAASFFVSALWPSGSTVCPSVTLKLFVAAGIAFGLSSYSCLLALPLFGSSRAGIASADTVITLLSAIGYLVARTRVPPAPMAPTHAAPPRHITTVPPSHRLYTVVAAIACVALLAAAAASLATAVRYPDGGWDAWAIWNLRARFLFRDSHHWLDAFSPYLLWSHPDYPLLLPTVVARSWIYLQVDRAFVPLIVSLSFAAATAGLLYAAVAQLRGATQAMLATLSLLSALVFAQQAALQYADVPVGYFFLATLVLLACHDLLAPEAYGLLICGGLMAALAAWTKNEGLLFLLAVVATRIGLTLRSHHRQWSEIVQFGVGAAPVLVILALFKVFIAPPNDLIGQQSWASALSHVTDLARYAEIAHTLSGEIIGFGSGALIVLLVYALLAGGVREPRFRRSAYAGAATIAVMLGGFCGVYLVTPHGLTWHLAASLPRLLVQLWPSVVFTIFMWAATPEEVALRRPARQPSVAPVAARRGRR